MSQFSLSWLTMVICVNAHWNELLEPLEIVTNMAQKLHYKTVKYCLIFGFWKTELAQNYFIFTLPTCSSKFSQAKSTIPTSRKAKKINISCIFWPISHLRGRFKYHKVCLEGDITRLVDDFIGKLISVPIGTIDQSYQSLTLKSLQNNLFWHGFWIIKWPNFVQFWILKDPTGSKLFKFGLYNHLGGYPSIKIE